MRLVANDVMKALFCADVYNSQIVVFCFYIVVCVSISTDVAILQRMHAMFHETIQKLYKLVKISQP